MRSMVLPYTLKAIRLRSGPGFRDLALYLFSKLFAGCAWTPGDARAARRIVRGQSSTDGSHYRILCCPTYTVIVCFV